jgi:hypothetical protein
MSDVSLELLGLPGSWGSLLHLREDLPHLCSPGTVQIQNCKYGFYLLPFVCTMVRLKTYKWNHPKLGTVCVHGWGISQSVINFSTCPKIHKRVHQHFFLQFDLSEEFSTHTNWRATTGETGRRYRRENLEFQVRYTTPFMTNTGGSKN